MCDFQYYLPVTVIFLRLANYSTITMAFESMNWRPANELANNFTNAQECVNFIMREEFCSFPGEDLCFVFTYIFVNFVVSKYSRINKILLNGLVSIDNLFERQIFD